jgi:hypothetical protein
MIKNPFYLIILRGKPIGATYPVLIKSVNEIKKYNLKLILKKIQIKLKSK